MCNYEKILCEGQLEAVLAISPFIATLCPISRQNNRFFVIYIFKYHSVVKTFQATLEFINLQQCDQVASVLRTVDFWLIVC